MNQTKTRSVLCAIALTIGCLAIMASPAGARPDRSFSDLPKNSWATTPIRALANYNIVSGGTNGKFRPNDGLKRGELAKLLTQAFETPQGTQYADFSDVTSTNWATPYINASVAEGYMEGFPNNIFKPNGITTRAQVAKILVKAKGYSTAGMQAAAAEFPDVKGAHWSYAYIQTCALKRLMGGYPDGTFRPNDKITRAEAAVIIYRALLNRDMLMNHSTTNGISYERYRRFTSAGPMHINVLRIPKDAPVAMKLGIADDRVAGLEQLISIAKRNKAVAAINGDFFSVKTGGPSGLMVNEKGNLLSSPIHKRSCLIFKPDKTASIERIEMNATVTNDKGKSGLIHWVNKIRDSHANSLVAFTPSFGYSTLSNNKGTEVVVNIGKAVGTDMTITGRITGFRYLGGNTRIPAGCVVLSGIGSGSSYLASNMIIGHDVELKFSLSPAVPSGASVIGGGPRIVRDGIARVEWEPFKKSQVNGRDPRSAIGIDKAGNIIIVEVDGRMPFFSIGMSLKEMANYIKEKGAVDAMNFDSGGSSTLYFSGATRNYPSSGRERLITNSLLFVPSNAPAPEPVPVPPVTAPEDPSLIEVVPPETQAAPENITDVITSNLTPVLSIEETGSIAS